MEKEITKTLIESPYPFWLIVIIFSIISGLIQCFISYFKERGKNLATKEDLVELTSIVEEVRDNYNKALETHKHELKKEFESIKPILNLCNTLDEKLINLIVECKENIDDEYLEGYYFKTADSIYKIGRFLQVYRCRYEENIYIKKMIPYVFKVSCLLEIEEWENLSNSKKQEIINQIEEQFKCFLNDILPKFK